MHPISDYDESFYSEPEIECNFANISYLHLQTENCTQLDADRGLTGCIIQTEHKTNFVPQ